MKKIHVECRIVRYTLHLTVYYYDESSSKKRTDINQNRYCSEFIEHLSLVYEVLPIPKGVPHDWFSGPGIMKRSPTNRMACPSYYCSFVLIHSFPKRSNNDLLGIYMIVGKAKPTI